MSKNTLEGFTDLDELESEVAEESTGSEKFPHNLSKKAVIAIALALLLLVGSIAGVAIIKNRSRNGQTDVPVADIGEQVDESALIGTDLMESAQTAITSANIKELATVTEDTIQRIETTTEEYTSQIETVTADYQSDIDALKDQYGQDSEAYANALAALQNDYTDQLNSMRSSTGSNLSSLQSDYNRQMNDLKAQNDAKIAELRAQNEELNRAQIEALEKQNEDLTKAMNDMAALYEQKMAELDSSNGAKIAELNALAEQNAATIADLTQANAELNAQIAEAFRALRSYLTEDLTPYYTKTKGNPATVYGYTMENGKYKIDTSSTLGSLPYNTTVRVVGYVVREFDNTEMGYFRVEYGNGSTGFVKSTDISDYVIIPVEPPFNVIIKNDDTSIFSDFFAEDVDQKVNRDTSLKLVGYVYRDGVDTGVYQVEYSGRTLYVRSVDVSAYSLRPFYNYAYINKDYIPLYASMNAEAESGYVLTEIPAGTYVRIDGRVYNYGEPTEVYHVTLINAKRTLDTNSVSGTDTEYFSIGTTSGYVRGAALTTVTYRTTSVSNQGTDPAFGKMSAMNEYYAMTNDSSASLFYKYDYQLEGGYLDHNSLTASSPRNLGGAVYVTVTGRVYFDNHPTSVVMVESMDGTTFSGLVDEALLDEKIVYTLQDVPEDVFIRAGSAGSSVMPLHMRDKDYRLMESGGNYYSEVATDTVFRIYKKVLYNGNETDYAGRTIYAVISVSNPTVKGYISADTITKSYKVVYACSNAGTRFTEAVAYVDEGTPILSGAPFETEAGTAGWVNDISPDRYTSNDTQHRDIDRFKPNMNVTGKNYTLIGWTSVATGDYILANKVEKTDVVTSNITVYAVYERNIVAKLCPGDFSGEYSDFNDTNIGVFTIDSASDALFYTTTQRIALDYTGSSPVWKGETKDVILPGVENDIVNGAYKWQVNSALTVSQVAWKISNMTSNGIFTTNVLESNIKNAGVLHFTDNIELHPLYGFNVRYYEDMGTYRDVFVCYGDSAIDSQYIAQAVPTRTDRTFGGADGYSLYGWTTDSGALAADTTPIVLGTAQTRVVSDGMVLYAVWTRPVTVSFDKGDATSWTQPQSITKPGYYRMGNCMPLTFDLPSSITYNYDGWIFNGWNIP